MATILLVEDDSAHAEVVKMGLESEGYTVVVTETGEHGLTLAKERLPDLILMDMLLPGITGLEALRRLKQAPDTRNIPVIAITAVGARDVEEACMQAGACDFISKPYELKDLKDKLGVIL